MAIEGLLHEALQLLARMEGHHPPRGNGDFLAGLGITSRTLGFLAQLEVAEARELHHFAAFEGDADFLEEGLDHVLRLPLVQADFLEHEVGEFRLGEGDFVFHVRGFAWNFSLSCSRMEATTPSTSESVKVLSVSCITIRRARLFWPGSTPFPRYRSNTSTSRTKAGTTPRAASSRAPAGIPSSTTRARSRRTTGIRDRPAKLGNSPSSKGPARTSNTTGGEGSSYFCCRGGCISPITPSGLPEALTVAQRPGWQAG